MSKQLASATHKLLTSFFRQIRRWEQAKLPSTYYTGCVYSILGQHFNGARRRDFGQFFQPYYTIRNFWIFAENRSQDFFGIFGYKPVLGSPDDTLTKF